MRRVAILSLVILLGAGCAAPAARPFDDSTIPSSGKRPPYEWIFTAAGETEYGMPKTAVSLKAGAKTYPIGTYGGSCNEVAAGETGVTGEFADPGEVSRVQCWFAGGGNEIGVYEDGPIAVVKVGDLDEGSEETGSFRGDFKTVVDIQ